MEVENIGGIDGTTVGFGPGVTVLTGRNATNRTSFLQALMAGLGSDRVSLKADADEGHVAFTVGERTYERHFERVDGRVRSTGSPYLDDPEVADLFAFLLENNEARRAVEEGDDLREFIMRPVDTAAIREEIQRLTSEKERVDEELAELDRVERELPGLRDRRSRLDEDIEAKRAELDEKDAARQEADSNVEATREAEAELEAKLEELRDARSELEDVQYDLKTEREALASYRTEQEEIAEELASLADAPADELEAVEARIHELRDRKRSVEDDLERFQSIIQFNQEQLESERRQFDAVDDGSDAVTDALLADEEVTCWTCGSTVARERIEGTLDELRSLRQSKRNEQQSIDREITDLRSEKQQLEEQRRDREEIQREQDRIERRVSDAEGRVEELEERRTRLQERIDELESAAESLRDEEQSELLDRHREANQLEFELERLEDERAEVTEEIEEIEARLDERDDLEPRREDVQSELEVARTKVSQFEVEAVNAFNDHMAEIIDLLGYENIERIWIERREQEVREGRGTISRGKFDLHVVRSSDSGTIYEDSVDHLSESEREVAGLVFALSGYLVHEVHETVPFMLLDSLEAIDSDRIAALVGYFAEYAPYLIVTLLPEDAAALDDDYERVTEI